MVVGRVRPHTVYFFFQAEDGIRDIGVTGVPDVCSSDLRRRTERLGLGHTCAGRLKRPDSGPSSPPTVRRRMHGEIRTPPAPEPEPAPAPGPAAGYRSEERRVGKGVDLGGRRIIKKKKHG